MLELLYATGIRVTELISLNVSDVNLPGCFIKCGPAGKSRIIPLYPAAVQALTDYIQDVRPKLIAHPEEQSLFVNLSGERMSRQGFWKIVKHYQELAEIDKDITPIHCVIALRRTCWRTVLTCGRYRRCWDTVIFLPHTSTPSWSNRI